MAGDKVVPLTWGIGGPQIGTAKLDENGFIMADIEDERARRLIFGETTMLSVYTPNAEPGTLYDDSNDAKEK